MKFKKIDIDSRDVIIKYLNKENRRSCAYCFTDIFIWKDKYNTEYHNLEIKYNSSFHDRFMIIDNNVLYHCGASFKDLGKKCFAITKVEEQTILENLMKKL